MSHNTYWSGYEDGRASAGIGLFDVILTAVFIVAAAVYLINLGYDYGVEETQAKHQEREAIHKRLDRIETALGTYEAKP